MCGNLLSWGPHGVAFIPGESPGEIWPAIAEALYRIRRAEKLSGQTDFVMVKDLTEAEDAGARVLSRFGYRPLRTEPMMMLEIPEEWRTHEDYLSSLRSSYRKAAGKVSRKLQKWR